MNEFQLKVVDSGSQPTARSREPKGLRNPYDPLAEAILNAARAVEEAERLIKAEILRAAEKGDVTRIRKVVRRWMNGPVSAVLQPEDDGKSRQMTSKNRNDSGEKRVKGHNQRPLRDKGVDSLDSRR